MASDIRFKQPFTCIIGVLQDPGSPPLYTFSTEPRHVYRARFSCGNRLVLQWTECCASPGVDRFKEKSRFENFENLQVLPCLFVLDDLLNEAYSRAVCDLFTKGNHHRNLSVILITQNFFHQAPHCRDISLNAKCVVALKNVRERNQFAYLASQVLLEASASLCESYREATRNPHGYLILDFAEDTDDLIRYRTNLFPSEYLPVIYARVND
jgi:hypothetical protein